MKRLHAPIHFITPYKQTYPGGGILYKYFSQPSDPVLPISFVTNEFKTYLQNILNKKSIFEIENNNITFRNTWYTKLLRILKIL